MKTMKEMEQQLIESHNAYEAACERAITDRARDRLIEEAWLRHRQNVKEAAQVFAAERGWKVSMQSAQVAAARLAGERISKLWNPCPPSPVWLDHAIAFTRDRKPVAVLSMPYWQEPDNTDPNLNIEVLDQLSWHYPGRTLMVLITAKPRERAA